MDIFFYHKIVAKILSENKKGTAFLISPRFLLTAYHVVTDSKENPITVNFPFLYSNPLETRAFLKDYNKDCDLALLELDKTLDFPYQIKLSKESLYSGLTWKTYGYPVSMLNTGITIGGSISNEHMPIENFPYEFLLTLSTPFEAEKKGFSGSPLIVGDSICGFIRKKENELNSYLGANSFHQCSEFLEKNGIELATTINFKNNENFENIQKLINLSLAMQASINNDINGVVLPRKQYLDSYCEISPNVEIVYLTGIAGIGKSAILRSISEQYNPKNYIFLSASQLADFNTWQEFSTAHGLVISDHQIFFSDLMSSGDLTLFIDGMDRIGSGSNLLKSIFNYLESTNKPWKLVATLRDINFEEINRWLPTKLKEKSFEKIFITEFNDIESNELTTVFPYLKNLLSSQNNTKDIVRRPFFTKILAEQLKYEPNTDVTALESEINIIQLWWDRGGSIDSNNNKIQLQNALMHFSSFTARNKNLIFSQADAAKYASELGVLLSIGVVQEVRSSRFKFAHDLFFEWSFFYELEVKDDSWINDLKETGEPPLLGHVIHLLSEYKAYVDFDSWKYNLIQLQHDSHLRNQWIRIWLVAPFSNYRFMDIKEIYYNQLKANDYELFRKILDIFETEKTQLISDLIEEFMKERGISSTAIAPVQSNLKTFTDIKAWSFLINLIVEKSHEIPTSLSPHIVEIFTVWQTMLFETKNHISSIIIPLIYDWLIELENYHSISWLEKKESKWDLLNEAKTVESSLRSLLMLSSKAYPEYVNNYLDHVLTNNRLIKEYFCQIMQHSKNIAALSAEKLYSISIAALFEELPKERLERWLMEEEECRIEFEKRPKPVTEQDKFEHQLMSGSGIPPDFGSITNGKLSISSSFDHRTNGFYPVSPLKEPFHSLFKHQPDLGIKLVHFLTNHAIKAWLDIVEMEGKIAIPIVLNFPWGEQTFWGDKLHYKWSNGHHAPKPISCGLMAMKSWAFNFIANEANLDDVLQKIIQGSHSFSILAIATAISLEFDHISPISVALISCSHLWMPEFEKKNDRQANLIGLNNPIDKAHRDAVQKLNRLKSSSKNMSDLFFQVWQPNNILFNEELCRNIYNFKDNPPYFYEHEKNDVKLKADNTLLYNRLSELGNRDNYRFNTDPTTPNQGSVEFYNPLSDTDEVRAQDEKASIIINTFSLHIWVIETIEKNKLHHSLTLDQAVLIAKDLDIPKILQEKDANFVDENTLLPTDAFLKRQTLISVLGTAAIVKLYSSDTSHIDWADEFSIKFFDKRESMPLTWKQIDSYSENPLSFFSLILLGDIRLGDISEEKIRLYFELLTYRFDCIYKHNISIIWNFLDLNNHFAWVCLDFMLRLSLFNHDRSLSRNDRQEHHNKFLTNQLQTTLVNYFEDNTFSDLYVPPAPWVESSPESVENDHKVVWTRSSEGWDTEKVAKIILSIPIVEVMNSEQKNDFINFFIRLIEWTIQYSNIPDGYNKNTPQKFYDDHVNELNYEWDYSLSSILFQLINFYSFDEFKSIFLERIGKSKNSELSHKIFNFLTGSIIGAIMDHKDFSASYFPILDWVIDFILKDNVFNKTFNPQGKLSDPDIGSIIKNMFFILDQTCSKSARFANGDWSEINRIIPLAEKLVIHSGWIPTVMFFFLKLCKKSKYFFPAETFISLLSHVFSTNEDLLVIWAGKNIPGSISEILSYYIEKEEIIDDLSKNTLLSILDTLIELGDSNSVPLRNSAFFKGIRK